MPKAWGLNLSGVGSLGIGSVPQAIYTPTDLNTTQRFKQIATDNFEQSGGSTFGLTDGGDVYGWGRNSQGALATGSTDASAHPSPQIISGLSNIVKIAAGSGVGLALDNTGNLYGWGNNAAGELALGNTTRQTSPVQIASNVADVAAGGNAFTIILTTGGAVQTAGGNGSGQLGTGNTTASTTWQTVTPASGVVIAVFGLRDSTLLLFSDGSVKGWGSSQQGQLGNLNVTNTSLITLPISNVIEMGGGWQTAFFRLNDGTSWALGHNVDGLLGVGQTFASLARTTTALQMVWPTGVDAAKLSKTVGSGLHGSAIAIGTNDQPYTWGANSNGQQGDGGATGTVTSPQSISGVPWVRAVEGGTDMVWVEDLPALSASAAVRSWATIVG